MGDWECYFRQNPDLIRGTGDDEHERKKAKRHYRTTGKPEGRTCACKHTPKPKRSQQISELDGNGCNWSRDWECYFRQNPDLIRGTGDDEHERKKAKRHYRTTGKPEGRTCACIPNVTPKPKRSQQISELDGNGCNWSRDWECYFRQNPDLIRGTGDDIHERKRAKRHYLTKGKPEGRTCACIPNVPSDQTG